MNRTTPANLVQMKSSRLREKSAAMRAASTHAVFLGLLLGPAAVIAQTTVSTNQSPLITIVSPKFNDVLPYGNVRVRAQLRADELPETFTATLNGADGYKEVHYPADSLLNDLFTLPTMNGDGTLGGGAGFSIDSFFTSISGRPLPVRQAFATNPACGPQ